MTMDEVGLTTYCSCIVSQRKEGYRVMLGLNYCIFKSIWFTARKVSSKEFEVIPRRKDVEKPCRHRNFLMEISLSCNLQLVVD